MDVVNVEDQYLNDIYTPDFLTDEIIDERQIEEKENDSSLGNESTNKQKLSSTISEFMTLIFSMYFSICYY